MFDLDNDKKNILEYIKQVAQFLLDNPDSEHWEMHLTSISDEAKHLIEDYSPNNKNEK